MGLFCLFFSDLPLLRLVGAKDFCLLLASLRRRHVVDDADEWGDRGRARFLTFDGENWVMYDLSLLPEGFHELNTRERLELTFQANAADGLIWFSGSERNNLQLYLRVCQRSNVFPADSYNSVGLVLF